MVGEVKDATALGGTARLGKIELAILQKLSNSEGLTSREEALSSAYPGLGSRPAPGSRGIAAWSRRRGRAEAATTRAIKSLQRKGLVLVERSSHSGRTLLRAHDLVGLPPWEELAQAEEDLAAHCRRVASAWAELGLRAAARAECIRLERSERTTEDERARDLAEVDRLELRKRR